MTSGFKANSFTLFRILQNRVEIIHSIGFPKYYKEGKYMTTENLDPHTVLRSQKSTGRLNIGLVNDLGTKLYNLIDFSQ